MAPPEVIISITATYKLPADADVDQEVLGLGLLENQLEDDPEQLAEFLSRGDVTVTVEAEVY